ncbi:hypothetical protein [Curtobacterium sp. MCPF17_046]|uniref:hypothetical protein n=1 Tax=Curtobacterium sp. MCPF17_046 TaxID=2175663 RepID=UPI000D984816|nr:hypothetical protein [Curtobacterium sp. MCPF17_046]PYY42260.1 hypothetical protein DEJ32_02020 [Curtobacterium sp. MCPF17_046]
MHHEDDLDDTVVRPARRRAAEPDDLGDTVGSAARPAAGTWGSVGSGLPGAPAGSDGASAAGSDGASASASAQRSNPAARWTPSVPVPAVRIGDRVHRLDRPVVVGRRPTSPRVVPGAAPELVTVASPTGLVSSSHVRFSAAGTSTVVDDLGSTNGTVIRPAGAPPHRMPSGASMVVLTGTVVDIGDGNGIEVLSPFTRAVPPVVARPSDRWPSDTSSPGPSPDPGPSRTPESDPEP